MLNPNGLNDRQEFYKIEQTIYKARLNSSKRVQILRVKMLWYILVRLQKKILSQSLGRIGQIPTDMMIYRVGLIQYLISFVKRYQNTYKYWSFDKIKRNSLNLKRQQIKKIGVKLLKSRQSSIKLIFMFLRTKKLQILKMSFDKIILGYKQIYLAKRQILRIGLKKIIIFFNERLKVYLATIFKQLNLIRNIQISLSKLSKVIQKHNMRSLNKFFIVIPYHSLIKKSQLEKQMGVRQSHTRRNQTQQLLGIRQKQQLLERSIVQIRIQKQAIDQLYRIEIVEAQKQQQQISRKIQQMRFEKQNVDKRINYTQTKLSQKVGVSMDEIYQMCYHRLLWFLLKMKDENREIIVIKQEILQIFSRPLLVVKSQSSYQNMMQQNRSIRQLLSIYQQIYGYKLSQMKYHINAFLQSPFYKIDSDNQSIQRILEVLLINKQQKQNLNKLIIRQLQLRLENIKQKLVDVNNTNNQISL